MTDANSFDNEATSDYADSVGASEFTSIKTAALQYLYEHGRRYQGVVKGRYGLPNDNAEQVREGIKHKMYQDYILEGELFRAPVGDHPQKIVDLGTGVGFWAFDVAEKFPSARVIGTDISPIQSSWTPPNLEFRVEDLEDEQRSWTGIYADADLIHTRSVLQTLRDPKRLLERAFQNLKPGGWLETHDIIPMVNLNNNTIEPNHPLNIFYQLIDGPFAQVYGWKIRIAQELPQLLQDIGFVNITQKSNMIPLGRWHRDARMREVGMFHQSITLEFVSTMLAKHDLMGLDEDEANKLGQGILDTLNNLRIHACIDWSDTWAQKPTS